MDKSRKISKWLGILALILLIPLLFVSCGTKPTPVVSATAVPSEPPTQASTETPMETPTAALPTAAPVIANGQEPPPCTFPLTQITAAAFAPANYVFSQPKMILNSGHNSYNIIQWLPNNQQVLVTQELLNTRSKGDISPSQESIELFNPLTNRSQVYATRYTTFEGIPLWLPQMNAVIYPARNLLGMDQNTNQPKFSNQIWVSYGDPGTAQKLVDNLPQLSLDVKPDGSEMIYFSDMQIFKRNISLQSIQPIAFDPTQWDYAAGRRSDVPLVFHMVWQPGTSLVFLYGDGLFRFSGYTFILNIDTGKVCELNLGGWVIKARWSSDGRYLAIIRTHDHFPINSSDLAVLDTLTGKVYSINVISSGEGKHFVYDFVWAPDNHHLLAIGVLLPPPYQSDDKQSRLYLVDFVSGQSDDVLPMYTFYANDPGSNLAWSSDGSKLLILCPTEKDEQLCFISVHKSGQ